MTVVFDPTLTTDTRFEPPSQVHIQLLGSFHLLKAGQPVSTRGGGKTETLLARLALHPGRLVPRAVLLETLWPDCDTSAAGQSLNSLVYSLHKRLGDALHGATPVQQADGSYRLNLEAGVGVDVWFLEHLAEAGRACAGAGDRDHARSYYERAIQLYHGDLYLSHDLTALLERERLRTLYLTMLARLADYSFGDEDYGRCLEHALRLLECEPTREDAHRLAMRCYVRCGERSQAMRQYRLCKEILRREFDASPEPSTTALFERVRDEPAGI